MPRDENREIIMELKELVEKFAYPSKDENAVGGKIYEFAVANCDDHEDVYTTMCDEDIFYYLSSDADEFDHYRYIFDISLVVDTGSSLDKLDEMQLFVTIHETDLPEEELELEISDRVSKEELFKLLMAKVKN